MSNIHDDTQETNEEKFVCLVFVHNHYYCTQMCTKPVCDLPKIPILNRAVPYTYEKLPKIMSPVNWVQLSFQNWKRGGILCGFFTVSRESLSKDW